MKRYVIKAFSGVFQYCLEKFIFSFFPSKTHKKFPSQEDKIRWFPSQLQSEQPASRKTTIFYIVRQNAKWAWQKPSNQPFSGGWGGGRIPTYFSKCPHQARLEMLENIINSKTNPSAVTNFPASSSEHLLFSQPARFLWGTDKVMNRFVGCPCLLPLRMQFLSLCLKENPCKGWHNPIQGKYRGKTICFNLAFISTFLCLIIGKVILHG